jgi:ATP-dependent DNA helicase RecG
MTLEELKERIRLGEDTRTEFKDERVQPDDLAAAIVSLANTNGGDIFLGVANDGSLPGVSNPDQTTLLIDNVCRQNIEPPLGNVSAERHGLDGKILVVLHVPRGPQRPYRTNKGVYYVRGLTSRRMASQQELLEIYQAAKALFPDQMAVEDHQAIDLDREHLCATWPELHSLSEQEFTRTLINLKLLFNVDHPTLGGLLCFGRDPQRARPYARITAIRFRGNDVTENFLDRKEIGGTLAQQIRAAQVFGRQHLTETLSGSIYPPPVEGVDEAIINAIAHRDYGLTAQTRLFIFDDRVEIISPGKLFNSLNVESLKYGCHEVRNTVVFAHLARLNLATNAGLGIRNMFSQMRARSLPEPQIVVRGSEFQVTLRLTSP